MHLSKLGSLQGYEEAVVNEAAEAATRNAANPRRFRGCPWCVPGERNVLLPEHKRLVAARHRHVLLPWLRHPRLRHQPR